MNRILQRYKELKKFEKRIFKLKTDSILISLKPLSLEQVIFFTNEYNELIKTASDDDLQEFFTQLFDFDDLYKFNLFFEDEEFQNSLLKWFFDEYLPFGNFENIVFGVLNNSYKELNNDLFVFLQELAGFGYKYTELSKLNHKEIIDLCFKELMLRDYDRFLEFTKDLANNIKSNQIKNFVEPLLTKRKEILSSKKEKNGELSDFDKLAAL